MFYEFERWAEGRWQQRTLLVSAVVIAGPVRPVASGSPPLFRQSCWRLVHTHCFPGWRIYAGGERLPDSALRPETVDTPPGEHRVLLRRGDTPMCLLGRALTVTYLAVALALVVPSRLLGRRGNL